MADGHQECIYKGILDGIKKFGKDRINVQKDHRIDQCKCNEQTEKSFVHSSASGYGDPKIDTQNSRSATRPMNTKNLLSMLKKRFI